MRFATKGSSKGSPKSDLHFEPVLPLSRPLEACAYEVKVIILPKISEIQVSSISDPGSLKTMKNAGKLSLRV